MASDPRRQRRMVVTGAGTGIGAAVATQAAAEGDLVIFADLDLEATAIQAERAGGGNAGAYARRVDVTDSSSIDALVARVVEEFGTVDVLVNCAGGFTKLSDTEHLSDADWEQVVRLNLYGTFACCRAVLPIMRAAGYGRIVNVSSETARMPLWPTAASYVAAKAGVLGFTRHLALEVAAQGITVNAICPGTTLTQRVKAVYTETMAQQIMTLTPMGRPSELDEQVRPILFLASDAASYVTGATLDVNGGRVRI